MSEYKRLGTARLLRDAPFTGKEGDVVIVVAYPDKVYGPVQDDGSDATGGFWAIPSATVPSASNLTVACIGKPGCGFEWVTRESTDLKEGDVVRAKCKPSPEMVVRGYTLYGDARVMWFNNGELQEAIIPMSVLEKVL